jgi:hypothetical protein
VFDESNIPDAVRVLERREASIWHACQLIDLAAYLRSGGIGSRDRVVCDLDDISHGFAAGWAMMPNSSGPIALQLAPSVLTDASQAAFCLRSAMTSGFDPARDSLADPRLIDELFWFEPDAGFPLSTWLRFGDHLRPAFGSRDASAVDVLLSPARCSGLDLRHVVAVWVDPIHVRELQLIDVVSGLCDELGVALRIRPRTMIEDDRRRVWADIVSFLRDGPKPLIQLVNRVDASPEFGAWAAEMQSSGRSAVWDHFARNLHEGTLRYLAVARAAGGPGDEDQGFWSRSRRTRSTTLMPQATETVRACGHLVQSGDNGTCYACIGRARSAWRYDG